MKARLVDLFIEVTVRLAWFVIVSVFWLSPLWISILVELWKTV